ncbi:hypothetical protein ACFQV2_20220 [Actinokineospora soli]|uniref:Uncharacterized protein n=1 Tax=Actinokineospora soli TaxID=1048753 RepID=A0ABW2TNW4_9PSEU
MSGRVTRFVVRYQSDRPSSLPVLSDVDHASPGRVVTDRATGLMVAELVLDRPITCGEYAVVEYAVGSRPGLPVSYYSRTLHGAVSEYTQLIRFEGRPPAFCASYWRADAAAPARRREPVRMGLSRASTLVVRDGPPGIVGTEWFSAGRPAP